MSVRAAIAGLAERFATEEAHLNRLDAATGDGDHGSTMARGMSAAATAVDALPAGAGDAAVFKAAGNAFMSSAGGASGALIGSLLLEFATQDDWVLRLQRGADRIARVGKAQPGDKTMLDALAPAAAAFPTGGFPGAAAAASAGAAATIPLAARCGRARNVERGGAGSIDPGAVSMALIVEVLAEACA